jgi:hypothetical protein
VQHRGRAVVDVGGGDLPTAAILLAHAPIIPAAADIGTVRE